MSTLCTFTELSANHKSILKGFINGLVNFGEDRNKILSLVKKIYNFSYLINVEDEYIKVDDVIGSIIYIILDVLYCEYIINDKYIINDGYTTYTELLIQLINSIGINFDDELEIYFDRIKVGKVLTLYKLTWKMFRCLGICNIYDKFEYKIKTNTDKEEIQEYFNNNLIELLNGIINTEYKYKLYKLYKLLEKETNIRKYSYGEIELEYCFDIEFDTYGSLNKLLNKLLKHSDEAFDLLPKMYKNIIAIKMTLKENMLPDDLIEITIVEYLRDNNIMIDSVENYMKCLEVLEFVRRMLRNS